MKLLGKMIRASWRGAMEAAGGAALVAAGFTIGPFYGFVTAGAVLLLAAEFGGRRR